MLDTISALKHVERRRNRSSIGESKVKIYVNFGGAEILMESVEERRVWKQFRSLLMSAELVDGAGVACKQFSKSFVANPQVFPSDGAACAVKKFAHK